MSLLENVFHPLTWASLMHDWIDLYIVIFCLRRGIVKRLPSFLVIQELILFGNEEEISMGELTNLYLTSFLLLFNPFYHYFFIESRWERIKLTSFIYIVLIKWFLTFMKNPLVLIERKVLGMNSRKSRGLLKLQKPRKVGEKSARWCYGSTWPCCRVSSCARSYARLVSDPTWGAWAPMRWSIVVHLPKLCGIKVVLGQFWYTSSFVFQSTSLGHFLEFAKAIFRRHY